MKVSYNWLKEYVDIRLNPQELGDKLSKIGLVVENLQPSQDDWIYTFENLSNRPDWLSVHGIVREIMAVTHAKWHFPEVIFKEIVQPVEKAVKVSVNVPDYCLRYAVRVIRGVKVSQSPSWMVHRLESSGIRSVNNIVDITNYVLLEYGHPLHAFNLNAIKDKTIEVRWAREESLYTLDGCQRALNENMLVVADSQKVLAIAGVMGGQNAEILEDTQNILLESAYFHPDSIRQTSRCLGLSTESSYRFERGANIDMVTLALDRAAGLMQELAGGKILQGSIDQYVSPLDDIIIKARISKINRIIGLELNIKEVQSYFKSIHFNTKIIDQDTLYVKVPNSRRDVYREEDLAEEVARLYGYDYIPVTQPVLAMKYTAETSLECLHKKIRTQSICLGLWEIITYSFISPEEESKDNPIRLMLPLSEEQSVMRQTLFPGLLKTFAYNWTQHLREGDFFELGHVYQTVKTSIQELPMWAMISYRGVRFVRACVENILDSIGLRGRYHWGLHQTIWSDSDHALQLLIDKEPFGCLVLVSPQKLKQYNVKDCSFALTMAELDLDRLVDKMNVTPQFQELSIFPAVYRDLVLKMPEDMLCSQIIEAIQSLHLDDLKDCQLFDIYRGKQLEEGYKSLGFALKFQSMKRTLIDEEVDQSYQTILAYMEKYLKITLREK